MVFKFCHFALCSYVLLVKAVQGGKNVAFMTSAVIKPAELLLMNSGVDAQSLNVLAESPSSLSIPVCGDGVPTLSHPSEENSNSSLGTGVPPRVPEPPDLADRSSQSSLASLDDAGPYVCFCVLCFIYLSVTTVKTSY